MTTHILTSLSIAVVCYQTDQQELKRLIASLLCSVSYLRKVQDGPLVFVYLIDNSPVKSLSLNIFDDYQGELKQLQIEPHLVSGHGNIGYGSAHNLILNDLKSDYHLMLNSDVVLDEQCLAQGIAYLNVNQTTAMASPLADYEDGDKQYLCKRYPSVFTLFIRGFLPSRFQNALSNRLAHYEMHDLYAEDHGASRAEISIISGCFMLCRTAALVAINGFDEKYFLYFEDFDLSLRIQKEGQLAFVPGMKINHGGGNAAKKGTKHIWMFVCSGFRFFSCHGWQWFRY